jgi:hypothetical protein
MKSGIPMAKTKAKKAVRRLKKAPGKRQAGIKIVSPDPAEPARLASSVQSASFRKFDFIILKSYPKERKFIVKKSMRKGIFGVFK